MTYEDFDHVGTIIEVIGPPIYICKGDLHHAFKLLHLNVDSYKFLGFTFMDTFYFDGTLVMGSSTSCADFEKLLKAI